MVWIVTQDAEDGLKEEMFWRDTSDTFWLRSLWDTLRRSEQIDCTQSAERLVMVLRCQAWSWGQVGVGTAEWPGRLVWLGFSHQRLPSPHTRMTCPTQSYSSCVGWQNFLPWLCAPTCCWDGTFSTFPGSESPVPCLALCCLALLLVSDCQSPVPAHPCGLVIGTQRKRDGFGCDPEARHGCLLQVKVWHLELLKSQQ